MKLLRHILSHLLLIFILFGLVSIYYYRYQLLPDNYVKKINVYTDKVHPSIKLFARKQPDLNDVKVGTVEVKNKSPDISGGSSVEVINKTESVVVNEKYNSKKVSVDVSVNNSIEKKISDNSSEIKHDLKVSETEVSEAKPDDKIVIKKTLNAIRRSVKNDNAISTDKDNNSTQDLLRAARIAFNKGQLEESIIRYKKLIELDNDVADFYGELGNVYYAAGKWSEAGVSYYEAAIRLLEQNKLSQVAYLQRVIQGLDAERAEKLAEKIN